MGQDERALAQADASLAVAGAVHTSARTHTDTWTRWGAKMGEQFSCSQLALCYYSCQKKARRPFWPLLLQLNKGFFFFFFWFTQFFVESIGGFFSLFFLEWPDRHISCRSLLGCISIHSFNSSIVSSFWKRKHSPQPIQAKFIFYHS